MGEKRPHPDAESAGHGFDGGARKRPKTNRPHKPKPHHHNVDNDSLNAHKKRARTIERLLARDNLNIPANKQNDLERELAALKQRIEDTRTKKERSKMIQKYHMVRFFERKKAMRFVNQLEKKLAQATDPAEVAQLQADLHVAQVDIDYARYFPFMEPYISLYAAAASGEKDETNTAAQYLRTPRPPMWTLVEKTREEGQAALERLQNRRPERSSADARPAAEFKAAAKPLPAKKAKGDLQKGPTPSNRAERRKADREAARANAAAESSDESDGGGFFEED